MVVQSRTDFVNYNFIVYGTGTHREDQTILQDAGRGAADMVFGTLMAQVPSSEKWVPFTDETATDGTQLPIGILLSNVAAADIVAGDVGEINIMVTGHILDEGQLVIENSKTLATVITTADMTVRSFLRTTGFQFVEGVNTSRVENS